MGILFDVIPVKYRRLTYLLATLALFVYGLWEASNGDWRTFAGSLLTALVTALAAGNSVPVGKEADPSLSDRIEEDPDEDNSPLLPIEYPNDESGTEAVFPNSDTLYQPGEKEGERFGAGAYYNSPEADAIRRGLREAGIPPGTYIDDQITVPKPVSGNETYPQTDNPHKRLPDFPA